MKLPIRTIIPVIVGVVLGAGGLMGATYASGGAFPPGTGKVVTVTVIATPEPEHGLMYPTRERIVNLVDQGILRYIKTTIVLEISDPEMAKGGDGGHGKKGPVELPKDLAGKSPVIEDKITSILSSKTAAELMTTEGKQKLKEDLRLGLNNALHDDRIMTVYFTDFIVQ